MAWVGFVMFEFGPFRLDAGSGILWRGKEAVELTPKALQTLLVLVRNRGRVMNREELRQAVWPDTYTEPSNLAHQILAIRKALGETSEENRYIQTIPRRGYRFVAEVVDNPQPQDESSAIVEVTPPAVASQPRVYPRLAVLLAIAAAAALFAAVYFLTRSQGNASGNPAIHSIAVLPLENLTGDKGQDYFVDGMTEAITGELARVGTLRVISRASAMQYRGSHKSIPQIGRELHVDGIVEGTVERSEDRVRVTAELLDTRSDAHVWSQSYDRDLRDVLSLQADLASSIARQVSANINVGRRQGQSAKRPVVPAAHDAYLKGRFVWNQRTERGHLEAIQLFEEALASDPAYAEAYAGLADAYALLGSLPSTTITRKDAMEKARAAARRAIELNPELAEAHTSLAFVLMHYDWNFTAAEKEFRVALQLDPNYATAHQWYAYDLMVMGRSEESLEENQRAQQNDPLSLIIATDRGELLSYAGKNEAAIRQWQEVVTLDPNFSLAHNFLARAYLRSGNLRRAGAEAEQYQALTHDGISGRFTEAYVAAASGQRQRARKTASQLAAEAASTGSCYNMAEFYMGMNDADHAIAWLGRALQQREGSLILLRVDPTWSSIRSDPRFAELLRRVGLARNS